MFDPQQAQANLARLRRALPGVVMHYAVKANPALPVLAALHEQGCRFDVASQAEWQAVQAVGGPLSECLYTQPVKRGDELAAAVAAGFHCFVADNRAEIDKLAAACPGAELLLRLRVSNPDCVVDLSEKFGCAPEEAIGLLDYAHHQGLRAVGLAFHVGSQSTNPQPFVEMLQRSRRLFDAMALAGRPLRLLDIGGGFPADDGNALVMEIDSFCAPIRAALQTYFPATDIVAEPGRYLVADAVAAVVRIIGKAARNGVNWYYIDDGLYGIFSGRVFDQAHYRFAAQREGKAQASVVAGPSCDSFDIVARDALLPELDVGDLLLAQNMGAYTNASASRFNGIPLTPIVTV